MRIDSTRSSPLPGSLRQALPGKAIHAGIIELGVTTCAAGPTMFTSPSMTALRRRSRHGDEGAIWAPRCEICTPDTLWWCPHPPAGSSTRHRATRSQESHLVFSSGRYEGTNQASSTRRPPDAERRLSSRLRAVRGRGRHPCDGEAVVRLIPDCGAMRVAPADSHSDGLLEDPLHPAAGEGATWRCHRCCFPGHARSRLDATNSRSSALGSAVGPAGRPRVTSG